MTAEEFDYLMLAEQVDYTMLTSSDWDNYFDGAISTDPDTLFPLGDREDRYMYEWLMYTEMFNRG